MYFLLFASGFCLQSPDNHSWMTTAFSEIWFLLSSENSCVIFLGFFPSFYQDLICMCKFTYWDSSGEGILE